MTASNEPIDGAAVPFDAALADRLMEEAGIDVLLATSKHNTSTCSAATSFIFFSAMDAIGHSRYLPIVIYERAGPSMPPMSANRMERRRARQPAVLDAELPSRRLGARSTPPRSPPSTSRSIGRAGARIGIEPGFLPSDAQALLGERLEGARFVDATGVLERMRAIKTPEELDKLRQASELITDSMLATIAGRARAPPRPRSSSGCGARRPVAGSHFEYCLLTLGASHNRAPSRRSAGSRARCCRSIPAATIDGYIGDLCRMGVLGEPDAELQDLLAEIEAVQQAAFAKVRAGAPGGDMIAAGEAARAGGAERRPSPTSSRTAWGSSATRCRS